MSRWNVPRSLVALTWLGAAQCTRGEGSRGEVARGEATREQAAHLARAPAPVERGQPPADASVPGTPDSPPASATRPARGRAPVFEPVVAGLSLLTDERTDAEGQTHDFLIARIDLRRHELQVRALGDAPFAGLRAEPELLVAVNGGFFDPRLAASGLLISRGRVLARERAGGGSGVLAVAKGRARLLARGERLPPATDFALQCGPRLVEPGAIIGIRRDDGQRAARTAACIREGGEELDLIVTMNQDELGGGPSLLQLARWLTEPLAPGEASGCDAALNLDGGPSTGMLVAGRPALYRPPLGPVPFVVLVTR